MKKIRVKLGTRGYDIFIGGGAVKKLPGLIRSMRHTGPVVVITDKIVNANTEGKVAPVIKKLPNTVFRVVVPPSERSKSLEVFRRTIEEISKSTKGHRPLIVAVGGGVVGDLAGFVAATYRRGVPLIQVPTTLLAQVDSSVGGKTGIDLPAAKNIVGAFYQPEAVLADTDLLHTLPRRQVRNGLAEVIKYAVIRSPRLFKVLENDMDGILSLRKGLLEDVIYECVKIKAGIVEKDEFDDKDMRIILNFGHTLGHAIEAASGYSGAYNHGEAIAVGMVISGEIALRLNMLKAKDLDRIKQLIKKAGLPVNARGLKIKDILSAYGYDKKFVAGSNRFLLPRRIGRVEIISDIPGLLIRTVLTQNLR
ncbi:MAG: 3-dehydroquinate synthase [Candidatus Omnitrophota bacterium]